MVDGDPHQKNQCSYMEHAELRIPPPLLQTDDDSGGSAAMAVAGGGEAVSAADTGRLADLQSQLVRSICSFACMEVQQGSQILTKSVAKTAVASAKLEVEDLLRTIAAAHASQISG